MQIDGGRKFRYSIKFYNKVIMILDAQITNMILQTNGPNFSVQRIASERIEESKLFKLFDMLLQHCCISEAYTIYFLHFSRYDELELQLDSKYAIDCLTEYIYKWQDNDWFNCKGM